MRQGEGVVAHPAPVRVVDRDAEIRLVVEQAVDDVGRFARGWDRGRVIRRMPGRDVRIEECGGFSAMAVSGIVGAQRFPAPRRQEGLAIGARNVAGPEQGGERLALLGIHQSGQGSAIGVLAQMPSRRPGELAVPGDRARVGHAGQAEIGRVGQDRGEHHAGVGGRQPGLQVRERVGEPGPAVHVGQNGRDAGVRHQGVEPLRRFSAASGVIAFRGVIFSSPPLILMSSKAFRAAFASISPNRLLRRSRRWAR